MTTLTPPLQLNTPVERSAHFVYGDVDGEMVALHIEKGSYVHLNQTASLILQQLEQGPLSASELCPPLCAQFQVSPERCETEVLALLQHCLALELLRPATP
jgi:hypothetical protein